MNEWKFPLKKNAKRAFTVRPLEAAAFDAQFQLPDARHKNVGFNGEHGDLPESMGSMWMENVVE